MTGLAAFENQLGGRSERDKRKKCGLAVLKECFDSDGRRDIPQWTWQSPC